MKNHFRSISAATIFALLTGCGGGSGGGDSDPTAPENNTGDEQTGVFIDSAVEGLTYATATRSGMTNDKGEFKYLPGEMVTFSLGEIKLGSAQGAPVLTPIEILNAKSIYGNAHRMVHFLTALDDDHIPENGIRIQESYRNTSYSADFTSFTNDQELEDLFDQMGVSQADQDAVGWAESIVHLMGTLDDLARPQGELADGLKMHMPFTYDVRDLSYDYASSGAQSVTPGFALDLTADLTNVNNHINESNPTSTNAPSVNREWRSVYDPREITISFWVKMNQSESTEPADQYLFGLTNGKDPTQTQNGLVSRYLLSKTETSSGEPTIGLTMQYPEPDEGYTATYTVQSQDNILQTDVWHHFAFSYSPEVDGNVEGWVEEGVWGNTPTPGITRVYYDGESNGLFQHQMFDSENDNFERPAITDDQKTFKFYSFNGAIDDIRIYNRVLSEEEVAQLAQERK